MAQLPSAAVRTLVRVAEVLEAAQDDWWLIGGAAVALQGLAIEIADIDVLLSARDARQVIATLNIRPSEGVAIDRVRSDIWARWTALPLGVDLMAGLQIRNGRSLDARRARDSARRSRSKAGRSTFRRVSSL